MTNICRLLATGKAIMCHISSIAYAMVSNKYATVDFVIRKEIMEKSFHGIYSTK